MDNPRGNIRLPTLLKRPGTVLLILGVAGALASIYAGRQQALQYQAIEQLRVAELVDNQFSAAQDHIALRENLATVVAALFTPPPVAVANALGEFGAEALAIVPDLQTIGWLPEVTVVRAPEALRSLANSGVDNPRFIGSDGQSMSLEGLDRPLYPILDIAPESNRRVLGVDAGAFPDRLAAIRKARETKNVVATAPLRLVQAPAETSLLLYAPVFSRGGVFFGVIGFGYKVDRLMTNALGAAKPGVNNFSVRVFDENDNVPLFARASDGKPVSVETPMRQDQTVVERSTEFGGRKLRFVYGAQRDLANEGLWRGLWFALAGFALTAIAIVLIGFMANNALALASEVGSRRSAEERLKLLLHELNHRVRNVLSVAQAVVRLSFTSAENLSDVQKRCEGRLQALANAMSLLTASDWKSVSFRNLINEEFLPFAERIAVTGPDIPLKPRSAQTFSLLLYELATNAAKHGAFSVPDGKVFLDWTIDRSGAEPVFRLSWREAEGPKIAQPTRRGFGELLVRRIAPRDVAGRGTVSYQAGGFSYELEAPLREVMYDPQASPQAA